MASTLLRSLLAPRTWTIRCPDCLGRATRTDGAWSATERPRVVWTCSTCKGSGEVDVQPATDKEGDRG